MPLSYSKTLTIDSNDILRAIPLTEGLPNLALPAFDVRVKELAVRSFAALDWVLYSGGRVNGERELLAGGMQ